MAIVSRSKCGVVNSRPAAADMSSHYVVSFLASADHLGLKPLI